MKHLKILLMIIVFTFSLSACESMKLRSDDLNTVNKQWIAAEKTWTKVLETLSTYAEIMTESQKLTLSSAIKDVKSARAAFNSYRSLGDLMNTKTQVELLENTVTALRNQLLKELIRERAKQSKLPSTLTTPNASMMLNTV